MEDKDKNKLDMEAFFIRDASEEGTKINLSLPDGTETGNWLRVRGADSPTFKREQARTQRKSLELMKKANNAGKGGIDPGTLAMKTAKNQTALVAVLVTDWNFEAECTRENVINFLENAPQIQEEIDHFAADRENFFTKPPTELENTEEESSS